MLKKIKSKFILLFLIFLFGFSFFLRAYNFEQRTAFSTDQGRDYLKVWQHVKDRKLYLLGPKASVGNFYMPPFYYYLITPAIVLGRFNPISGGLFNVLVESFTPLVIFWFCKKFFNKKSAFFSSLLYAVSPLIIDFASFLWNPNTIPFFVSLVVFFVFSYLKEKKEKDFILALIIYSLAFQLHYQMLIVGFFLLFAFLLRPLKKLKNYLIIFITSFLLYIPYFYYEFTNKFYNLKGIYAFFTQEHRLYYNRVTTPDFFVKYMPSFFGQIIGGNKLFLGQILFIVVLGGWGIITLLNFKNKKNKDKKKYLETESKIETIKALLFNPYFLWLVFIILNLIGLRIYKGDKLGYYLSFMFMVPPVSLGVILSKINIKVFRINLVYFVFIFIILVNLKATSTFRKPGRSLQEKEELMDKIVSLTENKPYVLEIPSRLYNAPVRYLLAYNNLESVGSSKAELAIKVCYQEKDCLTSYLEDEKKGMPEQVRQKIDYSYFSENKKEEIRYKDFYIYIFKKSI
ncbi:hypothetical protein COT75_01890 [Candidatus Beckwithbacteria bacterium CG10_big_fil_rev_8_21_14_0_10_34_10]|uniref:Glycosyltransferase RgtA/B/C/D-like domain-containing protein n=1 Tax=Candidatus Beckwithbacteria bacterium CG10_big_fil_rev_8_21_14_0_10_34_10 TaxID=1974495 RepID=A0A2H0W9R3_9BACT|nr:MAG: hypothetical protein COT75_01890 [Candidatus Beckwithbacteria bacterium CG10_big_fil_rev_8_21_14_0_10_34_10]